MQVLIPVSYTHLDVYKRQGYRRPNYTGHQTGDPDLQGGLRGEDQRDGSERAIPLRGEPPDPVHLRPGSAYLPLVRPGGGGVMDKLLYDRAIPSAFWSIAFHIFLAYHGATGKRDSP